MLTVLLAPS